MLIRDLQVYIEHLDDDAELGISAQAIETNKDFALSYAVDPDVNEYGHLILKIDVELCQGCAFLQKYDWRKNDAARCVLPLPFSDLPLKHMQNRRLTVKSVIKLLEAVRRAQLQALENTPRNFRDSDNFEAGEVAVDALEEAIDTLSDIY